MNQFIIENAGNTCYIDSVLMALFYNSTLIDSLLKNDIRSVKGIYLQEFIKLNFIDLIRNNISVDKETMQTLKYLCFANHWRLDNHDEYDKQQDASEFYTFILELFEGRMIEIQRNTYTEGLPDKNDIGSTETIPFIPLSIPKNCERTSIKDMFYNWLYDNTLEIQRKTDCSEELKNVAGLNVYSIVNVPSIIGFSINRFENATQRCNTDIIIQKKIRPFINQTEIPIYEYKFHSAICHIGQTILSGHYYSFLSLNDTWYIFDDLEKPCLKEVDINDKQLTSKIKKECIFLIYKLI